MFVPFSSQERQQISVYCLLAYWQILSDLEITSVSSLKSGISLRVWYFHIYSSIFSPTTFDRLVELFMQEVSNHPPTLPGHLEKQQQ